MQTQPFEGNATVTAGDELELTFWDEKLWLDWDLFKSEPGEFAAELLVELQRRPMDLGEEPFELILSPYDAYGITDVDEDGDERIGAIVKARVLDVRPKAIQEQQASLATAVKVGIVVGAAIFLLFSIRPVLVEMRRVVRGFTDEEQEVQDFGSAPAISTVVLWAILVGGFVAVLYLTKKPRTL